MIRLNFNIPTEASWAAWICDCENATSTLVQSYAANAPVAINSTLYRGEVGRFHKHPFYGKCAYCETKVVTSSPDYVEHFRPKAGVRDINNVPVQVMVNGVPQPHKGYYWLAYKWENLLPTCWKCNTRHNDHNVIIGKGNRFPVTGTYGTQPGDEANEDHDLINPMHEDPSHHLFIDSLGVLHPVVGSRKGTTCINFFGLNSREDILNGRKKEYDNIARKIRLLFTITNKADRDKELAEITQITQGKDEYTIAAKKAIADVLSNAQEIQNSI